MAAEADGDSDRDPRGRFATGNRGGPGRKPGSVCTNQMAAAVRKSLTPERLGLVIQRLIQRAVRDGDVSAAKLLLERGLGRATVVPAGEELQVDLPRVRSFDDLLAATDALLQAATSGSVAPEVVEKLAGLVESARRLYETQVLAERVKAIENSLGIIETGEDDPSTAATPTPQLPVDFEPSRRRSRR